MITDDELSVLIIRACSSRNLFVKHHLVLLTFRERQLSWHHDVSLSTSSKYAASSPLLMRPRTTVSSANLTIEVELCEDTQSQFSIQCNVTGDPKSVATDS